MQYYINKPHNTQHCMTMFATLLILYSLPLCLLSSLHFFCAFCRCVYHNYMLYHVFLLAVQSIYKLNIHIFSCTEEYYFPLFRNQSTLLRDHRGELFWLHCHSRQDPSQWSRKQLWIGGPKCIGRMTQNNINNS